MAASAEKAEPVPRLVKQEAPSSSELVNCEGLQALLVGYGASAGLAASILDLTGNVIVSSRSAPECDHLRRSGSGSCKGCGVNLAMLAPRAGARYAASLPPCLSGAIDAAAPIVIEGDHVATLVVGRLKSRPPALKIGGRRAAERVATLLARAQGKAPNFPESHLIRSSVQAFAQVISELALRERRLAKLEKRLTDITAIGSDWIWDVDADWRFTHCGGATRAILGYEPAEILGKTTFDLMPPEEGARIKSTILDLGAARLHIRKLETWRLTKDGRRICLLQNALPLFDEQTGFRGYRGAEQDITEKKQAESALAESKRNFRIAAEYTRDWEYWTDLNSRFLYSSPSCKRITGREPEAFLADPKLLTQIIHPQDRDAWTAHKAAAHGSYSHAEMEFRIVLPDGRLRWIGHVCQPVLDGHGRLASRRESNRDITDRKEIEEAQRKSEARFRLAIDLSGTGYAVMNDEDRIVDANAVYVRMTGRDSLDDLLGRPTLGWTAPESRDRNSAALEQLSAIGLINDFETIYALPDGSRKYLSINAFLDKTPEGVRRVALCRDISERKQAQDILAAHSQQLEALNEDLVRTNDDLQRKNKDLDEFAYVASHDLKAPLRVIENALRWLEEDLGEGLDEESRDNMRLMRSRVDRMEKLLDDLLVYSRIGRKRDARYRDMVSGAVLENNIMLLLSAPESFHVRFAPAFAEIVIARMPIEQVLLNLIGNAIKHRARDDGSVDVDFEDGGDHYVFVVADDGPGIAPEYHELVFKMFQTLKPRDQVEGSGMGLAIAKKHVESVGGAISLESDVGKGCRFRFTWPKNRSPSTENRAE